MRLAVDTGGTFTDLAVGDDDGSQRIYKAPTTPDDPLRGLKAVLEVAAGSQGVDLRTFLGRASIFHFATTRSINAITTGTAARCALLATQGHRDVLVFREGGRLDAFDYTTAYPEPYVPRSLTFEVEERIGSAGEVVKPIDEEQLVTLATRLGESGVEAAGVALLWSVVNPAHELRVREVLNAHLPDLRVTLSHEVCPRIREYRRASAACIDASLKPLMTAHLRELEGSLAKWGFEGRVLVVGSGGAVLPAGEMADAPIHSLNSGPAMAPVAGRTIAASEGDNGAVVVIDTGGTTFDVSLVRDGQLSWTREAWIGREFEGHMTGLPSVDIRSIGAGGGSIAWVDAGGLLHVGPMSAGSVPGPACYGQGGKAPTVTDAAVCLGYIDPHNFLGGDMVLDSDAAFKAVERDVASGLGLGVLEAAESIMDVATEQMVQAIEEITINQGVDPEAATLVAGGGAAGLNCVRIARRLGCQRVIVPEAAAVLSASGALLSDIAREYSATMLTRSDAFDFDRVNETLAQLERRCRDFASGLGLEGEPEIQYVTEARYPHQMWEIDVRLPSVRIPDDAALEEVRAEFHRTHERLFAIRDQESPVEFVTWRAEIRHPLGQPVADQVADSVSGQDATSRGVWIPSSGFQDVDTYRLDALESNVTNTGPAIVETPHTTIVVSPDDEFRRTPGGAVIVDIAAVLGAAAERVEKEAERA